MDRLTGTGTGPSLAKGKGLPGRTCLGRLAWDDVPGTPCLAADLPHLPLLPHRPPPLPATAGRHTAARQCWLPCCHTARAAATATDAACPHTLCAAAGCAALPAAAAAALPLLPLPLLLPATAGRHAAFHHTLRATAATASRHWLLLPRLPACCCCSSWWLPACLLLLLAACCLPACLLLAACCLLLLLLLAAAAPACCWRGSCLLLARGSCLLLLLLLPCCRACCCCLPACCCCCCLRSSWRIRTLAACGSHGQRGVARLGKATGPITTRTKWLKSARCVYGMYVM